MLLPEGTYIYTPIAPVLELVKNINSDEEDVLSRNFTVNKAILSSVAEKSNDVTRSFGALIRLFSIAKILLCQNKIYFFKIFTLYLV